MEGEAGEWGAWIGEWNDRGSKGEEHTGMTRGRNADEMWMGEGRRGGKEG